MLKRLSRTQRPSVFTVVALLSAAALLAIWVVKYSRASAQTCPNEAAGECRPYDDLSPWNTEIGATTKDGSGVFSNQDPNSDKYLQAIKNNGNQLTSDPTQFSPTVIPVSNSTPKVSVMLLEGNYGWGNGYTYDNGDNSVVKTTTATGVAYGNPLKVDNVPIPADMSTAKIPVNDDAQVVFWNTDTGEEWAFWQFRPTQTQYPAPTNWSGCVDANNVSYPYLDPNTCSVNYTTTTAKWAGTNMTKYHTKTDASNNHYYGRLCGVSPTTACAAPSTMGLGGRGAGTPYFAGLIRQWEVASGTISHALSFAYNYPCGQFVYPAAKSDGKSSCTATTIGGQPALYPPEGTRLQLDPTLTDAQLAAAPYNLTTPSQLVVAHAMQKYGLYIIDNSGRPKINLEYSSNPNWNTTTPLNANSFGGIPWTAFHAVTPPCDPATTTCSTPTDTQAPSVPGTITAGTTTSSSISLSWVASTDNVGVTGYKIYRNGSQVGTSTTTSYTDSGLTASTSYSYTISAYDAAGNNSTQNTAKAISTTATTPTCTPATNLGNINCDAKVDIYDLSILLSNYNKVPSQTSYPQADLNSNNLIDIYDLSILLTNFGT